jgi:AIPR protein
MRADDPALVEFAQEFQNEMVYEAAAEGAEAMMPEVLTRRVLETFIEIGEVENVADCYLKQRGIEVSGYGIDDGDTLNLVATLHRGEMPPAAVSRREVETAFRRLLGFWERCRDQPLHESLEESSDAWSMALDVHRSARKIRRIRMFVVTDGLMPLEYLEPGAEDGVEVHRSVWDIGRLHRLHGTGMRGEPVEIDFIARFGRPLPCISPDLPGADYAAYLAACPANWLADIYEEFGARLLEKNVRSFLQFTGKVNRGMRDTLAGEDAHRFFAYNNGISATASGVELDVDGSGAAGIIRLRDLQIVNGGQTTASIHRAHRSGIDLGHVAVQAKITEIDGDRLEEMVPLISRYANSQNRVSVSDLSSNDPFHIEVESLSRSVWAPATGSTMRETRWFYERARGQYQDARNRETTRARRRVFREIHPTSQKFTKTDLAKFENAWAQRPWEVSLGAQKNFTAFMVALQESKRGDVSGDVAYFQRLVAKAILWRRTERIVSAQKFGGYRANIVAYSIAKLSHATAQRLDLDRIWQQQDLDEALDLALADISHQVFRHLTAADRPTANVTEWAKREECWNRLRIAPWEVPTAVEEMLLPAGAAERTAAGKEDRPAQGHAENSTSPPRLRDVPGDAFLAISSWAKETNNLSPWDRRFASTIGVRVNRDRPLTSKQVSHAERILAEARELGFNPLEKA